MAQNPFIHRGMLKSSRLFWGRNLELSNIYSCLLDSEEEPQSVAVLGQRRIGKSSLLYRIYKKELANEMYAEQLDRTITILVTMQNFVTSSSTQFYEQLLEDIESLNGELKKIVEDARMKCENDHEKSFKQVLRKLTAMGLLLLILIDEFEAVSKNENFDLSFFNNLRALMQDRRLAFVISIQSDLEKLWEGQLVTSPHSSPFFNVFQHFTLRGFKEEETVSYLQQFCSPDKSDSLNPDEVSLIRRLSGRHPFFINIAAYHLIENKISGNKLTLSEVEFEIINDPAVLLSYKYYWNALTDGYRYLLMTLVSEGLEHPYSKEVESDLHWLCKLSLLDKTEDGSYVPFSECFLAFLCQKYKKNGSTIVTAGADEIFEILSKDESTNLEFKSSLRWDVRENKKNEELEIACLKTIAAFLNTHGGTLIIGVDDEQNVLGLEQDYQTLKWPNKDGFERHLYSIVKSRIGTEFCELFTVGFPIAKGFEICKVVVQPTAIPAFVDREKLYFRTGNSTDFAKTNQDAYKYIISHWQNNGNIKHL
jgi:AAA+ ATPase superfamily predicted ATPase